MDPRRFGHAIRSLRQRRHLRQDEVGAAADVSRTLVSRIGRGLIENVPYGRLVAVGCAVGAEVELLARWHGEGLDRLIDQAHAETLEAAVGFFRDRGWEVEVETTFSIYGERGSIDLFGRHPPTGIVSVAEIKATVPEASNPVLGLDRNARLAPQIARDRGWPCRGVARILIIADGSTARRRVAAHAGIFETAFPVRGREVVRWMEQPTLPAISGLILFDRDRAGRRS